MTSRLSAGFTLIELIIVVAIIGILSTITLASLGSVRAKARDSARVTEIREIDKALQLYYASHNSYPAVAGIIDGNNSRHFVLMLPAHAAPIDPDDGTTNAIESALVPLYLPRTPGGGALGRYYYESDGTLYCLATGLEVTNTPPSSNMFCFNSGNNIGIASHLVNPSRGFAIGNVTGHLGC